MDTSVIAEQEAADPGDISGLFVFSPESSSFLAVSSHNCIYHRLI